MLSRKDLFKDTIRKAAHAWKRIVELRLTGPKSTYVLPTKDLSGHISTYNSLTDVLLPSSVVD